MRIDEDDQVSASRKHLVFAYYITGHGFGHATRVVEIVRHLFLSGHHVHVVTGAPDFVFTTEIQSLRLFIRKVLLDCGAVQTDALTVDHLASLEKKLGRNAMLVDAEHAFDPTYSRALGVDIENLIVCQPDSREMALEIQFIGKGLLRDDNLGTLVAPAFGVHGGTDYALMQQLPPVVFQATQS